VLETHPSFVRMITWNDNGEATEFAPSSSSQFLFYDLSAYYIQWYKSGRAPAIIRDATYYSHRTQIFDPNKILTPGADEVVWRDAAAEQRRDGRDAHGAARLQIVRCDREALAAASPLERINNAVEGRQAPCNGSHMARCFRSAVQHDNAGSRRRVLADKQRGQAGLHDYSASSCGYEL
jgi:hypothetical protein